jgi:hypothetical protein
VLDAVAEGTSGAFGDEFFRAMVRHFARALEVDRAFITECADHPVTRVRTLAVWSRQAGDGANFEYDLAGTAVRRGRRRRSRLLPSLGRLVALPARARRRVVPRAADPGERRPHARPPRVLRLAAARRRHARRLDLSHLRGARRRQEIERIQALARLAVVRSAAPS